jgi:predicted nucleic acid-binding protein
MAFFYFDSTALVKRYSRERGTRLVNALFTKRDRKIIVGLFTLTEFYSALALKARQGELTRDDWYSVVLKFEAESDRGLYQYVSPTTETFVTTKHLIMEYPMLRAAQALHLALAVELKPLRVFVVSADQQIVELCRPLGLKSINPEDD